MIRTIFMVAILSVGATAASAQNLDAIKQRQEIFKSFGAAAKVGTGFIRGETKFDVAKAKAALTTYAEGAKKLTQLFPDNSRTGGDTAALPVAWEQSDEFMKRFATFEGEAKAAAATVSDEASFKAEWGKVMGNCGACHKIYRKPQS